MIMKKILGIVVLSLLLSVNAHSAECIKGDCYNGFGTIIYKSGNKYTGYTKNGKRYGQGTMEYKKSGNIAEGSWINNKKEGSFIVTGKKGVFIGLFKEGKKNGLGTFFENINGKLKLLHIFEFKSGVREGEGILVYRYGKKIVYMTMKNDERVRTKKSIKLNTKNYNMVLRNYNLQSLDDQPAIQSHQLALSNTPSDTSSTQSASTSTNTYSNPKTINFTIKDKKEQCAAIGFKPETDKFADCVLRLVELDVKKQQSNKIANAQNSGNEALVKQLQRQEYDRGTDALLNLGQQLLQPKSSSYSTCSYIDLGGGMSKVKCN